jgi:hypothetical protein
MTLLAVVHPAIGKSSGRPIDPITRFDWRF